MEVKASASILMLKVRFSFLRLRCNCWAKDAHLENSPRSERLAGGLTKSTALVVAWGPVVTEINPNGTRQAAAATSFGRTGDFRLLFVPKIANH